MISLSLTQECFNSPYGTSFFSRYAENIPGESTQVLSEAAKENEVYLVGGVKAAVDLKFPSNVTVKELMMLHVVQLQ